MRDVYYEEELRYLKEEGARFAGKYPRRAGYLNLESAKDRDPRVEALFEGFAFIAAGIRERIDDALPNLAAGLAELVWPQLLHPIPATCVAEFKPRPGTLQGICVLRRGTPLFTDPDPATGVSCQFATTREVRVCPVSVWEAQADSGADGKDVLTVSFKFDRGIRPEALNLSPVRVFINDELPAALHIRKMLLHHAEEVILSDDAGRSKSLPPQDVFAEGGFGEDDALFPEPRRAGRALDLIRDYFAFPERFMFIDIRGLDALAGGGSAASALSLKVRFDRKFSAKVSLSRETFKLHCVPAVNVFRRDAEPISVDGRKYEYDLVSDAGRPDCFAIHSVASVMGIDGVTGERRVYEKYRKTGGGKQRFYTLRAEELSGDGRLRGNDRRLKLSMNGRQTEEGRLIRETLRVETWQTNGALARKVFMEGAALRKAAPDFPDYVTFTNITKPSPPVNPPGGDTYIWAFLSHLSCAYTNFGDAESLKELLRAYDWGGNAEPRPEIEAIRSVSIKPSDLSVNKAVLRGAEMNIAVDERAVPEENLFLLGTVLARSLSCMSSINTFLKLILTMPVSGGSYEWYCRSGERWEA
ncbi:MAG: type VI secretion system baseplate subunit TssF [Chitinispirillales bacterium]|jgi:type VI secretion system protein ImpG|nr:type VI secretion system baseplate subunit TssF [Chitinispirillales bacterium]